MRHYSVWLRSMEQVEEEGMGCLAVSGLIALALLGLLGCGVGVVVKLVWGMM